ncbi:DNA-methyltransferase [Shewanella baltica]|uniref:DNA-methyltransferase n=1 Tax=Shewanella baltica TaxID=62322 RepID=UPI003D7B8B0A
MENQSFKLTNLDAVTWLKEQPDCSIDLLITDPPYESLEKHRKIGTTTRLKVSKSSSNQWFEIFPNSRFEEMLTEIYRVMTKNSHFYLFCDQETAFVIKPMAEKVGFKFWKPLIWDKMAIGMGYHYRARYEFILFFEKGKRKLNDLSIPDVLAEKRVWRGYPTEKPVNLAKTLILQSSSEGDIIADPFCGAGFVGRASLPLKRRFIGNDINPEAIELTRNKLIEL